MTMIIRAFIAFLGIITILYAGENTTRAQQTYYDSTLSRIDDCIKQPDGPCNCQKNLQPFTQLLDSLAIPKDPKTSLRFKVLRDSLHSLVEQCRAKGNLDLPCKQGTSQTKLLKSNCPSCSLCVTYLVNFTKEADSAASKGDSSRESFSTRKWFWSYFANAAICATCDSLSFANAEEELFEKVFLGSYVTKGWNSSRFRNAFNSYPADSIASFVASLKQGNDTIVTKLLSSKNKASLLEIFKQLLGTDPSLYSTFSELLSYREVMRRITGEFAKVRNTYEKYHGMKPSERIVGLLNFWREGESSLDCNDTVAYNYFNAEFRKKLAESYNPIPITIEKNDRDLIKAELDERMDHLDSTIALKIRKLLNRPDRTISFQIAGFFTVRQHTIQLNIAVIDDSLETIPVRITRSVDLASKNCSLIADSLVIEIDKKVEDFEIFKELIATILKRPITQRDAGGLKGFSLLDNYIDWMSRAKVEGSLASVEKKDFWKFMVNDHVNPQFVTVKDELTKYLNSRFMGKLGEAPSFSSDNDCIRLDLTSASPDSLEISMYVGGSKTISPVISIKDRSRSFEFIGNIIEVFLLTPERTTDTCDTIRITTVIKPRLGTGLACASFLFPGVAHAALASYADSAEKARLRKKAMGFIIGSSIIKIATIAAAGYFDYEAVTHTNNKALCLRNSSIGIGFLLDLCVASWSCFSAAHEINVLNLRR